MNYQIKRLPLLKHLRPYGNIHIHSGHTGTFPTSAELRFHLTTRDSEIVKNF